MAATVTVWSKDYPDGSIVAAHRHREAQLLYALSGVMTVETPLGCYVVPPQRGLWVPSQVEHQIATRGVVRMRTLYVNTRALRNSSPGCQVVDIPILVRELIRRAFEVPNESTPAQKRRLHGLLLDELSLLSGRPIQIPMPVHEGLRALCEAFRNDPSSQDTLKQWADRLLVSERAVARTFKRELNVTFGQWQRRARLVAAFERLAAEEPVTTIALELGYDSPSAFAAMFKRETGLSPSQSRMLNSSPPGNGMVSVRKRLRGSSRKAK